MLVVPGHKLADSLGSGPPAEPPGAVLFSADPGGRHGIGPIAKMLNGGAQETGRLAAGDLDRPPPDMLILNGLDDPVR